MTGSLQALGHRLRKDRNAYLMLLPGYSAFVVLVFAPLVAAIGISLFRTDYITYAWVGLGNYRALLSDDVFLRALRNTLTYVVILVPVAVGLSVFISLLIHPLPPILQSFFRGAFYLPSVVGGIVLTTVWLWIFNPTYGLLNYVLSWFGMKPVLWLASGRFALFAVCIAILFQSLGTNIILLLAGLANTSEDVINAARIDGANSWQITWRIRLPLLRPILAFVIAIQTIAAFQVWETIYLLTNGGPNDASTSIVFSIYQTAFQNSQWGLGAAMGVILMVIVMAITLFQTRYWGSAEG